MCIPPCALYLCVCVSVRALCAYHCVHTAQCIPPSAYPYVHIGMHIDIPMCIPPCAYCQAYHVYVSRFSLSSLTTAILIPLLHAPSLSRSLSLSHTHTHTHTHTNTCTHTHTPHTHPAARVVEMLLDVWVMEYGASAIFLCYLSLLSFSSPSCMYHAAH